MSSSSIISAIKSAILTETQSSVKIHERSLWSVIIEYNRNSRHDSWNDFKVKSYKGKSLILTRHLFHFIYILFLGLIWLFYFIFSFGNIVFTGKRKNMNKSSSGINMIVVSAVLVMAIIIIVYILTFFIKDVVFHPNRAYINRKGVVTVEQPCYETQSFFLLNSATPWTSTGIQISDGDVVYITASGSMYSDIDDLYHNCKNNHKTNFGRTSYNAMSIPFGNKFACLLAPNVKKDTSKSTVTDFDAVYCMYGRKKDTEGDAFFGSLLYQIHPECQNSVICNKHNDKIEPIKQIEFNKPIEKKLFEDNRYHFTANTDGVLFLSFNDIYLDKEMCASIKKEECNACKTVSYMKLYENEIETAKVIFREDGIPVLNNEKKEALNREIWFNDNIGEILVNVRVEKNLDNVKWHKRCFASIYRNMNHIVQRGFMSTHLPILLFIIFAYFILDIVVSDYYMQKLIPKTIGKVSKKVLLFINRILHKKQI